MSDGDTAAFTSLSYPVREAICRPTRLLSYAPGVATVIQRTIATAPTMADEPGDSSDNFAWTGPQIFQLLPSTVAKHHCELLPPVLPYVTSPQ